MQLSFYETIIKYLSTINFVNLSIAELALNESTKHSKTAWKYGFQDTQEAIDIAKRAWKSIVDFSNRKLSNTEKENLKYLIEKAIEKIGESVSILHKVQCENREDVLSFLSLAERNLEDLAEQLDMF